MLAHFHSSGSFLVSSEVFTFFARGVDIVFFISDSIRGCRLSGSGDFETLCCDSLFCTISLVIFGAIICLLYLVFGAGMFPSGSLVKTDEKKFERASALLLYFLRVILLPSPSSAIRLGMLVFVFSLDWVYDQNFWGFPFICSTISFSYCL